MPFKYFIGIGIIFLCSCSSTQELQHNDAPFITTLVNVVQENHLAPKELNDALSKQIFHSFLHKIDPEKKLFLLTEINQLQLAEERLDDELKEGSTDFFDEAIEILREGTKRAEKYAYKCLEKEIDVFKEEQLASNTNEVTFVSKKDLKSRWELMVKKQFIKELYVAEIVHSSLTFKEQKEIALKKTGVFFKNYFYEIKSLSREALLEMYLNAYVSSNDYQSSFLSPESKQKWDDKFNRTFVGVGISIETTVDYPIIKEVLFDGPAWKTKKIDQGDRLMKISNEKGAFIDVAGFPLKKNIDLLKGAKGSSVKVIIKKATNQIEEVTIERGQILMSQTMSFVLENELNKTRIGYIYLPRFYVGNDGCASHVLQELGKLKALNVKGIIVDLRNNQGGSSREAIEMIGYFLKGEAVMQTIYANGNHNVYRDEDEDAEYLGKVIVMVNERSSSASELFSGTLQDYGRAIVVGNQTFGKGTMQNFFDITDDKTATKFGEIKLSMATFYTGNGRSTQYNGIRPDIVFPSENMYVKTGERAIENALKVENIETSITTEKAAFQAPLKKLRILSEARQLGNAYFQEIIKKAALKKKQGEEALMTFNYKTYKQKNERLKTTPIDTKPVEKFSISYTTSSEFEKEKIAHWKLKMKHDEFIYESMLIMNDYLRVDT